ncbi:MAG: hypothetical protein ACUVUC_08150 [Thermoguttaceae bacterium]
MPAADPEGVFHGLASAGQGEESQGPVAIGSRREIFVDDLLIGQLTGARLVLHHPTDEGPVLRFDKPWEGDFCGYCTVIKDGELYRMYYRGKPRAGRDGSQDELTCYAESRDGRQWTKPELGLFEVAGSRRNNVILANMPPLSHNFCPLLDGRPGVPPSQRFKALAGTSESGLVALVSADGIRWQKLREKPVITQGAFDSQNVAFWSESEQCYVCYFRTWLGGVRRISRTTSTDFLHWTPPVLMEYRHRGGPAPLEHLYTNQTHPYFRAPHIYIATAARFLPGRQALSAEQARAIGVAPGYFRDLSETVLLSSRGGGIYDRTFLEGFVRPGLRLEDWVSRTNYAVLNIVPTGPQEMSLYVNHNYAQPTAHLRRYSLRLDGLASVQAPYQGGELVTRPLVFSGRRLLVNFATSAAGGIRVEIQNSGGQPILGYGLAEAQELIGNQIERAASWRGGEDVGRLAGRPVRLRFVIKDADLYALRFE